MKQIAAAFALALVALPVHGEEDLRTRLADQHAEGQDQWIYNDIAAGLAAAKKEGKPLYVTFRCVPCHACMEFDGLVAGGDPRLKKMTREFVAVRQVEMKGVDLSQVHFDYDLNWAAMFLNADGTVYARYGTQSAEGPDAYNSVDSLVKTMERVLEFHGDYPGNRAQLAGKRARPKPYATALDMPGLPNKEKFKGRTEMANCIHCHNIHDAEVFAARDAGTYSHEMLWRYPLPGKLGLELDRKDGLLVREVVAGSPAAEAEVEPGEHLSLVNGQLVSSIADIQWVLHGLPNTKTEVELECRSEDSRSSYRLVLEAGWKQNDISWRGSMWSVPPRLRIWLPEPDEKESGKHRLPEGTPAVVARWINTKEEAGRLAKKAGLQTGDLIIEIEGKPVPKGGGAKFSTHVKLNYKPGQKLPLTVWRNGKRVKIALPLVE